MAMAALRSFTSPCRAFSALWVLAAAFFLLPAAADAAQLPKVAIAAAAETDPGALAFKDPQARLLATGRFAAVDLVDVMTATPTLGQLQAYDAVMTWSNYSYASGDALGDLLADYVDSGGGVVVAVFANTSTQVDRYLGGRWISGGYEIVPGRGSVIAFSPATLGAIHDPGHPTVAGVTSFDGGTGSFRPYRTTLSSHGVEIASWNDGKTLVAVSSQWPTRVDLGFVPSSAVADPAFWVPGTDGDLLLANAMSYAAGQSTLGPRLSAAGLVAGQQVTLTVDEATPGGLVAFAYSAAGPGPTSVSVSGCGILTVELSQPIRLLSPMVADPMGQAVMSARVPAGAGGVAVWIQAFDAASCRTSNLLAEVVG